jgi:DnaK suppressor protein
MSAKKTAKTHKPASKPAAKAKPVAAKGKASVKPAASKVKAAAKPAAKPAIKKVATKPTPAAKNKAPAVTKPAAKLAAKAPAAKPVTKTVAIAPTALAKAAPVKSTAKVEAKPTPSAPPAPVVGKAKPAAKPAAPVTPPTPIRSAVAVKSSVSSKPSKETDSDEELGDSLSLLAGPRNVKPYQVKRDEEYMNKAQLEHFRNILASWKQDLMQEVDRTVLHMKDEAANFPDPNDRATQESEFSLELRTRDRERKLIRKIEEALGRIEDGSYGYCVETGEEIGVKRLEARPVATLSVEAQERRERREKQYGDRDDRYR